MERNAPGHDRVELTGLVNVAIQIPAVPCNGGFATLVSVIFLLRGGAGVFIAQI